VQEGLEGAVGVGGKRSSEARLPRPGRYRRDAGQGQEGATALVTRGTGQRLGPRGDGWGGKNRGATAHSKEKRGDNRRRLQREMHESGRRTGAAVHEREAAQVLAGGIEARWPEMA
jgi:hypothetical protein